MKTVGEHLVDHSALGPIGSGKICGNAADLPQIAGFHIGIVTHLIEVEAIIAVSNAEAVEIQTAGIQREFATEQFISAQFFPIFHGDDHFFAAIFIADAAFHRLCLDGGRNMDAEGACFAGGQCSEGGFELGLLAVEKNTHGVLLWVNDLTVLYTICGQCVKGEL